MGRQSSGKSGLRQLEEEFEQESVGSGPDEKFWADEGTQELPPEEQPEAEQEGKPEKKEKKEKTQHKEKAKRQDKKKEPSAKRKLDVEEEDQERGDEHNKKMKTGQGDSSVTKTEEAKIQKEKKNTKKNKDDDVDSQHGSESSTSSSESLSLTKRIQKKKKKNEELMGKFKDEFQTEPVFQATGRYELVHPHQAVPKNYILSWNRKTKQWKAKYGRKSDDPGTLDLHALVYEGSKKPGMQNVSLEYFVPSKFSVEYGPDGQRMVQAKQPKEQKDDLDKKTVETENEPSTRKRKKEPETTEQKEEAEMAELLSSLDKQSHDQSSDSDWDENFDKFSGKKPKKKQKTEKEIPAPEVKRETRTKKTPAGAPLPEANTQKENKKKPAAAPKVLPPAPEVPDDAELGQRWMRVSEGEFMKSFVARLVVTFSHFDKITPKLHFNPQKIQLKYLLQKFGEKTSYGILSPQIIQLKYFW